MRFDKMHHLHFWRKLWALVNCPPDPSLHQVWQHTLSTHHITHLYACFCKILHKPLLTIISTKYSHIMRNMKKKLIPFRQCWSFVVMVMSVRALCCGLEVSRVRQCLIGRCLWPGEVMLSDPWPCVWLVIPPGCPEGWVTTRKPQMFSMHWPSAQVENIIIMQNTTYGNFRNSSPPIHVICFVYIWLHELNMQTDNQYRKVNKLS